MSNLAFSDLQSEVYDHTGLDSNDTSNQTRVTRWLNYTQQDICSRWPWPFLYSRENVSTVPDYTTGTVTATKGTTSIVGSGTAFVSPQNDGTYFIQTSDANDWYNVVSISGQTITTDRAYVSTGGAGLTYTLRKFFYSLSSAVDEIIDIRNWNTPVKLIQVDLHFIDQLNPLVQSTNAPYGYMMYGVDSSGNLRFSPYPFPSDARLFEFRTKIRPTDSSISVPNKYAQAIAWGAIAVGFAYLRKVDVAQLWSQKYEMTILNMKKEYRQSEDFQPVLKSIDSVQRSKWISLPDQYPVIQSG